ncbi:MAG TPA: hypothetical protein VF659_23185 [Pyrinomonadaceae bacterium]|jgi:hypothetical protein
MQERPENFNAGADDPEATLVAPRFDADEARRAHPVIPLAEARERAHYAGPRARRGLRRPWPPALLAVVLLAVFAAGGVFASKVLRPTQPAPDDAAQTPAAVAPVRAAEAPPETETPPPAPPREVADAKPETRAPRSARQRRAEDPGGPARAEGARRDAEDFVGDEDEGRRDGKRGKGRARIEDGDGEKELRRAIKKAKDKAPRLVDVLVRP